MKHAIRWLYCLFLLFVVLLGVPALSAAADAPNIQHVTGAQVRFIPVSGATGHAVVFSADRTRISEEDFSARFANYKNDTSIVVCSLGNVGNFGSTETFYTNSYDSRCDFSARNENGAVIITFGGYDLEDKSVRVYAQSGTTLTHTPVYLGGTDLSSTVPRISSVTREALVFTAPSTSRHVWVYVGSNTMKTAQDFSNAHSFNASSIVQCKYMMSDFERGATISTSGACNARLSKENSGTFRIAFTSDFSGRFGTLHVQSQYGVTSSDSTVFQFPIQNYGAPTIYSVKGNEIEFGSGAQPDYYWFLFMQGDWTREQIKDNYDRKTGKVYGCTYTVADFLPAGKFVENKTEGCAATLTRIQSGRYRITLEDRTLDGYGVPVSLVMQYGVGGVWSDLSSVYKVAAKMLPAHQFEVVDNNEIDVTLPDTAEKLSLVISTSLINERTSPFPISYQDALRKNAGLCQYQVQDIKNMDGRYGSGGCQAHTLSRTGNTYRIALTSSTFGDGTLYTTYAIGAQIAPWISRATKEAVSNKQPASSSNSTTTSSSTTRNTTTGTTRTDTSTDTELTWSQDDLPAVREVGSSASEYRNIAVSRFHDVNVTHTFSDGIGYVADRGIVQGYADGTFRAGGHINRAEFVKMMTSAYYNDTRINECVNAHGTRFSDISFYDWFAPYVCAANMSSFGIVNGYSNGTFRPGNTLNAAEAVKMIVLFYNESQASSGGTELFVSWQDYEPWYAGYYRALQSVNALPVGMAWADQPITRGQVAEILYRLMEGVTDRPSLTVF